VLRCPACGGRARLTRGDEMYLDQLELEIPDV
jgi:Zn finger protein HypA/HybF involved in hydrogenase expression